MKRICLGTLLSFCSLLSWQAKAQYLFTDTKLNAYTQDFNSLGTGTGSLTNNSGMTGILVGYSDDAYPATFSAISSFSANDGSNSIGGAYNFGKTNDVDRAVGGIAGGGAAKGTGYVAVRLKNNSNITIKNLDIRYAMEQWYNSANAQQAYFKASYKTYTGTSVFTQNDLAKSAGGWTPIDKLTIQAPGTDGKLGQADGNSSTYRREAQHRLLHINLTKGQEIVIRFEYPYNSATNNNGLAFDDIVIYPETDVLYSVPNSDLSNASNWSQNVDGSGTPGAGVDFTKANCTYFVQGNNTGVATIKNAWAVTGAGSRIVVGSAPEVPATLLLPAGSKLTGTISVTAGSTLQLDGTPTNLKLESLGEGSTVSYAGNTTATSQNILPATYQNLLLQGNSPKQLNGAVVVAKNLTMVGGTASQTVQLDSYNLTLLRGATLTRSGNGQLVTNGTGAVRATVTKAGGTALFPVASSVAGTDFSPVYLTSGTGDLDETYSVRVVSGLYKIYSEAGEGTQPITNGGNVNKTWLIGRETKTPVKATLRLGWTAATEGSGFVRSKAFIDHNTVSATASSWDRQVAEAGATQENALWFAQRTGITSFSPFAVSSNPGGVLPVELVDFSAQRAGSGVTLAWATASEKNNESFAVERSLDGRQFVAVGKVAGAGSTTARHTYTYADREAPGTLVYYRLRQTDYDGTVAYSTVAAVAAVRGAAGSWAVVPNPGSTQFQLHTPADATLLSGDLYDSQGRQVGTLRPTLDQGPGSFDLSSQPSGMYLLRLRTSQGPATVRVVKQ